jgi:hypothetical protein
VHGISIDREVDAMALDVAKPRRKRTSKRRQAVAVVEEAFPIGRDVGAFVVRLAATSANPRAVAALVGDVTATFLAPCTVDDDRVDRSGTARRTHGTTRRRRSRGAIRSICAPVDRPTAIPVAVTIPAAVTIPVITAAISVPFVAGATGAEGESE